MVSTNDMRPGQSLIIEDNIYLILEYQHVKPGKGKAFVKTKLKNLTNGGVLDKTFRADENVEQAFIDKQSFSYLYRDNNDFVFMNNETYEQISLNEKIIDNSYINYTIKENDNNIDIFFDINSLDLIGWQTKDIYQNTTLTLLYSISKNKKIKKKLFKLPTQN